MKKKISCIIVLALILCAGGLFFYMNKNNDSIDTSLTVKNNTKVKIETVGLCTDNKIVLNRTNGENFYFPRRGPGHPVRPRTLGRFPLPGSPAAGQRSHHRLYDRRGAGPQDPGHPLREGFQRLCRKLSGPEPAFFEESGDGLRLGQSRGGHGQPGTEGVQALLSSDSPAQKVPRRDPDPALMRQIGRAHV